MEDVNKDEMSNSDFIEKVIRSVKQRHSEVLIVRGRGQN